MSSISIVKPQRSQENVYPNNIFVSLDSKCKQIIYESFFDVQKSFLVGKYSLEGSNNFPQNKNVGIKFIEYSIKKGSQDALYYYTKHLVTCNYLIQQDFEKAEQLVKKYSDENDPRFYLIYGLIYRHQKNLKKAIINFEIGSQKGNSDSMFYYAKMLYFGDGCNKNKEKADIYFELAKLHGCMKCYRYLTRKDSKFCPLIFTSPYDQGFDLIFLLDDANSIDNFSNFCNNIIHELWNQFPKVYFRFGIVFNTNNEKQLFKYQNLTKKPNEVSNFLTRAAYENKIFDNNINFAYSLDVLINEIEWDEKAEKVAICITNKLDHINNDIDEINYLMQKMVSKEISFSILNLSKNKKTYLEMIEKIYNSCNRNKFVSHDHFVDLDYDSFKDFVYNNVSSFLSSKEKVKSIINDQNKITCDSSYVTFEIDNYYKYNIIFENENNVNKFKNTIQYTKENNENYNSVENEYDEKDGIEDDSDDVWDDDEYDENDEKDGIEDDNGDDYIIVDFDEN